MGEPGSCHRLSSMDEYIVHGEEPGELISRVAASEREEAQTDLRVGVVGPREDKNEDRRTRLKA